MKSIILLISLLSSFAGYSQNYYLFVGTYTSGKSKGIYVYDFNARTATANQVSVVEAKNPSYLAIAESGKFLYSVNENGNRERGKVSAFQFSDKTGQLNLIDAQSSGGEDPCYISVNRAGTWAVVANYTGGSLAALPINSDGSVSPISEMIQDTGSGPNKVRQEKAHVHTTLFSPDEHYLLSTDLGTDIITVYRFSGDTQNPLVIADRTSVSLKPGSGPRHLVFHPTKPFVYAIEELSGTIDAYQFKDGKLDHLQRISSVAQGFTGDPGSADIHISPDGKFLYATNRGDANSIAVYSIDPISGKLSLRGIQPVMGKHPRNFIIEPGGNYLLVANRDTDNIVIFKINRQTGMLDFTGKQIQVPNPVCLKLLKKN